MDSRRRRVQPRGGALNAPDSARLLLVDSSSTRLRALEAALHAAGYTDLHRADPDRSAWMACQRLQPNLVLFCLTPPYDVALGIVRDLQDRWSRASSAPILAILPQSGPALKQEALRAGISDFLAEPFDQVDLTVRVRNLLSRTLLEGQLFHALSRRTNRVQNARAWSALRQLQGAGLEVVRRLALAAEHRDDSTGQHVHRVGLIAGRVAQNLSLPAPQVDQIEQAARLHDVGKIGIPDQILTKPGPLTAEEFEVMKTHTTLGARILTGSQFPVLQVAEEIALTHHERWDGNGYFPWLRGDDIPLPGRITAIADVFDALTHARPYKAAWPLGAAMAEIRTQRGRQFDPAVTDAFLAIPEDELRLTLQWANAPAETAAFNFPAIGLK